ncbi:probable purine permease 10 isoform X1 [Coffea arabica]|uniref:Probable purine permease n=1 Tax=Coffea arabica TaxID=13443 RepID=A0A6P6U780_COFAR|nr:probable purine permease 10 isoform X1 [Coffea arabica]
MQLKKSKYMSRVSLQVQGAAQESKFTESAGKAIGNQQSSVPLLNQHKRWLLMALFALLVLFGQSAATLLGRLYYVKGGNSKWLSAFLQVAGFPILLPFLYNTKNRKNNSTEQTKPPSPIVLGSIYMVLGTLLAAVGMLCSVGLLYLPVSTFSLINATQLGFNALFSFFLNSQKFTPFIVNSLVLLTTSSALLVLQNDDSSGSSKSSKGKYIIGFICTLLAAALCSLILSLTQFAINKILKRQRVKELFDFLIYESLVASCILLIGLFASGEWKTLTAEMNKFALGKTSYTMTLMWIAVCWQIFSIGIVGLILKVSSLFANVISTLGLPIVPILAVFMFKDKMSGVKAVAMLLAIWGFISYIYQHYLDDLESKSRKKDVSSNEISLIQN